MAKYVVNSRFRFARNFILAEKSRLRSSPLLQAAKRQAVKKPSFLQKTYKKYPFILRFKLGIANRFLSS
jgi:hypothetical protein